MIARSYVLGVDLSYLIADPKVDDINAAFKIGATVKELGQGADAAANLNYADTASGTPIGRVIVDGKVRVDDSAKTRPRDELYMLPDKPLHIGKAPANALWALQGSPPLLRDGVKVISDGVVRDQLGSDIWSRPAYRIAYGLTLQGRLVVVRTRTEVTLDKLADIMFAMGCADALNGDGGGSAYLWPADNGWGRKIGAALTIKKGEQSDMKPLKVGIDAGHGPNTAGKRCPDDSMREYHFNSVVARYVRDSLSGYTTAAGAAIETKYMHDDSRDVPLSERVSTANAWPADVYVSIHANAAGSGWSDANGIETYTAKVCSAKSTELAEAIQRELIAATGLRDRGVKREDFTVIAKTSMPAVLIEAGFMTNKTESALLKSDAYRRKVAQAIVAGLVKVFGLKAKPEPQKDDGGVRVVVNGSELLQRGKLIDNTTYVPARAIAEALGAKVKWDQASKTVYIDM